MKVIELSRKEHSIVHSLDLSLHLFSSRSSDLKGQSMLEMKTLKVAQGFSEPTINLWIFHCLQIVDCISGIASKSPIQVPFKRASNIFQPILYLF